MGLQHLFIGLFIGIVNSLIVDLVYETIKKGNRAELEKKWRFVLKIVLNILISIVISLCIRLIDFQFLIRGIFKTPIEPFRFIIFYQAIYYLASYIIIKVKNRLERNI
jgi:hypothetical protein